MIVEILVEEGVSIRRSSSSPRRQKSSRNRIVYKTQEKRRETNQFLCIRIRCPPDAEVTMNRGESIEENFWNLEANTPALESAKVDFDCSKAFDSDKPHLKQDSRGIEDAMVVSSLSLSNETVFSRHEGSFNIPDHEEYEELNTEFDTLSFHQTNHKNDSLNSHRCNWLCAPVRRRPFARNFRRTLRRSIARTMWIRGSIHSMRDGDDSSRSARIHPPSSPMATSKNYSLFSTRNGRLLSHQGVHPASFSIKSLPREKSLTELEESVLIAVDNEPTGLPQEKFWKPRKSKNVGIQPTSLSVKALPREERLKEFD